MIRRCPQCADPVPWRTRLLRVRPWRCWGCGALLRRETPLWSWAPGVAVVMLVFLLMPTGLARRPWLVLPVVALAGATPGLIAWLFERCVVVEIARSHCVMCGYSLRGLPGAPGADTLCPECGTPNPPAGAQPAAVQ